MAGQLNPPQGADAVFGSEYPRPGGGPSALVQWRTSASDPTHVPFGGPEQNEARYERDVAREHQFLIDAAHGETPCVDHAEHRIADGDEAYGLSFLWIGIRRHLAELQEEAADLAAWAALADEALDREHDVSDLHKQQIRAVLVAAAQHGARAHGLLTNARVSLGERP